MGKIRKRQLDPEATRASILDAAQKLFLENGFAATSMSQIASQAKVTKSLIHHHFQNKENLWCAIKSELFKEYHEAQRSILQAQGEPLEIFEKSFVTYFNFLKSHPELVRLISMRKMEIPSQDLNSNNENCSSHSHQDMGGLLQLSIDRISAAQDIGLLRDDIEPINIMAVFFSMIEHWFMKRAHYQQAFDLSLDHLDEAYLRDTFRIFTEGVLKKS